MPRMNWIGAMPLGVRLGDVAPPATLIPRRTRCRAATAGFSRRWTYSRGEFGRRNVRRFGSFQISHIRIHGYRLAAATAKEANVHLLRGTAFGARWPFAQRGEPRSVTRTAT